MAESCNARVAVPLPKLENSKSSSHASFFRVAEHLHHLARLPEIPKTECTYAAIRTHRDTCVILQLDAAHNKNVNN